MSFLDDIVPLAATAAGFYMGGPVGASLGSAGLGYMASQDTNASRELIAAQTNQMSADESQRNREFQERMSNSAYQRQVADMSLAGLNPMLAYIKGGGASTPSGSQATFQQPQYESPLSGALQGRLTSAQAAKTEAEVPAVNAVVKKTEQELENLKTDNDKAKQVIDNLKQEYQNLMKTNLNLTEVGNQLRESVRLMKAQIPNFNALTESAAWQAEINKAEAELRNLDVEAAKKFDNFGREYRQYAPLVDLLKFMKKN